MLHISDEEYDIAKRNGRLTIHDRLLHKWPDFYERATTVNSIVSIVLSVVTIALIVVAKITGRL